MNSSHLEYKNRNTKYCKVFSHSLVFLPLMYSVPLPTKLFSFLFLNLRMIWKLFLFERPSYISALAIPNLSAISYILASGVQKCIIFRALRVRAHGFSNLCTYSKFWKIARACMQGELALQHQEMPFTIGMR